MASTAFANSVLPALCSISIIEYLAVLAALTVGYNILLIAYRLTLHPLARYPGRFIEKISGWPLIYQCYHGHRHLRLLEAHQRYGSIVRIGPNTLDIDTVSAQTAVHRNRNTNVKKADWYKLEPSFSGATSVQTVIDKKEHDFHRRVLLPAFSDSALREQEQFIDDNVRVLLDKLTEDVQADGWSVPKDFSEWITFWGFDFISDLAFGSRFKLLEESKFRFLPNMVKEASRFITYGGYLPYGSLVRLILSTPFGGYILGDSARDAQEFFVVGERKMEERKAIEEKIERKDIFHYIFQSRDPETGQGFSHAQLMADSGLLIAAGADGVSVTVAGAIFYLLKNPACMENLVNELHSSFTTLEDVRSPKLQQLPYLAGVVHEALRLAPGVPSGLPREVLDGGLNVDGIHVPAGMIVSVSAYAVHHNEAYFPDSFAFRPERWIGNGENVSLARRALCTFSAGRFDCAGKNTAILACKLVLAKLLYAYEVRAAGGKVTGGGGVTAGKGRDRVDEFQLIDYGAAYRSGPMVEVKAR